MIEYFYSDPKVLQHYRTGPLGPHLDRFAQLLKQAGYTWLSGQDKLRVVVQLNQWLIAKQYRLSQLDDQLVRAFQADQRKRRTSHHGEKGTLTLLLRMLREADLIPSPPTKKTHGPVDLLVQDYAQFLIQERCLSSTTLAHRLPMARQFLTYCFRSGKVHLNTLQPRDISRFVLHSVREQRRDHCQLVTTTLRSFLDFLYQHGRLKRSLRATVPAVASGRPSDLPVFLEPEQIEQLLRNCDRSTLCGRRDYAILLLLARLGLRAHEVCSLTLEDINWPSGEVIIRGKGGREDRLPLPPDVGRALARYRTLRLFALYLNTLDAHTEVSPAGLLPYRKDRISPYIYSDQEVVRLVRAAKTLPSPKGLRGPSLSTLIGLLAVTGMRVGEAIGLDRDSVDLCHAMLTVRQAKGYRTRLVPLHPSTCTMLLRYERLRKAPLSPTAKPEFLCF